METHLPPRRHPYQRAVCYSNCGLRRAYFSVLWPEVWSFLLLRTSDNEGKNEKPMRSQAPMSGFRASFIRTMVLNEGDLDPPTQGASGNVWRHLWLSQLEGGVMLLTADNKELSGSKVNSIEAEEPCGRSIQPLLLSAPPLIRKSLPPPGQLTRIFLSVQGLSLDSHLCKGAFLGNPQAAGLAPPLHLKGLVALISVSLALVMGARPPRPAFHSQRAQQKASVPSESAQPGSLCL